MTRITDAILRVSPKCKPIYLQGFEANDKLLKDHGISTPLRETNLVAQFMGETGGGTVIQESGAYSAARILVIFGAGHHSAAVSPAEANRLAYDGPALFDRVYGLGNPRKAHELGNTKVGDGWVFRGIGPLQSTGRGAAKRWGDRCHVDFESNVMLMVDPRYVMLPPVFEWDAGNLNAAADRDDVTAIRKRINGGYNGLEDVKAWHNRLWPIISNSSQPAYHAATPSNNTALLQQNLNLLGYLPKLVEDGKFGPASERAVRWFQRIAGIKVDGAVGPVTLGAIQNRLDGRHVAEPVAQAA